MVKRIVMFPMTKKRELTAPLSPLHNNDQTAILNAILIETRQQTRYLRNVNRLVNFIWAGLISVAAVAIAGVVFWMLIVSVAGR